MSTNAGSVRIFNCTPHGISLTINGKIIRDGLPGYRSDGEPTQFESRGWGYLYPFPRTPAPTANGQAQFADTNTIEVSSGYMADVEYTVNLEGIDIFQDLVLYIYHGTAALVHNGVMVNGTVLTPNS